MSYARWLGLAAPLLVCSCHAFSSSPPVGSGRLTAAENLAGNMPAAAHAERLANCPSVVAGAATIVSEIPEGVELRITGGADAAPEIRRRALVLAAASERTAGQHRADGGQNAQFGRCPVVMRNTKVEVRDIPGGAGVTLKPTHPSQLEWLRREVESRSAQLAAPKSFGPGLARSCPSAAPNAQTTVTNTPAGIDVRIVASSPAGVRAIRERAKALTAEGAPRDERCPVSPGPAMSVVETKDGVVISVKARKGEDVNALRQSVRDRAGAFEAPVSDH